MDGSMTPELPFARPTSHPCISPEAFRELWLEEVPRVVAAHAAELERIRQGRIEAA